MSYHWEIAKEDNFKEIYSFLLNSPVKNQWTDEDVKRRVMVPLFLGQSVIFRNDDVMRGFLTIAFMSDQSALHQETTGIQNDDWRSGPQLWAVDFVTNDGGAAQMLRLLERSLNTEKYGEVRYFRAKYKKTREVNLT